MEDPKMLMCRGCLTVLATVLRHTRWIPAINIICWIAQQNLQKYEDLICAVFSNPLIPLTPLTSLIQRLVTLLLLNATANEALPLFLDRRYADIYSDLQSVEHVETIDHHMAGWDLVRLVPSWMACLLSVGLSGIISIDSWSWVMTGCRVRFMLLCLFLRWQWCFSLAKSFHLQSLLGQPSLLASFMAFSCLLTVPRLNIPARPRQLSLAAALSPLLGRKSSQSDVITWVKRFRLYNIFLVHKCTQ